MTYFEAVLEAKMLSEKYPDLWKITMDRRRYMFDGGLTGKEKRVISGKKIEQIARQWQVFHVEEYLNTYRDMSDGDVAYNMSYRVQVFGAFTRTLYVIMKSLETLPMVGRENYDNYEKFMFSVHDYYAAKSSLQSCIDYWRWRNGYVEEIKVFFNGDPEDIEFINNNNGWD